METWEWDGFSWSKKNPPVLPTGRNNAFSAYDSLRKRVLLFGGAPINDTLWEYNTSTSTWAQIAKTGQWPPATATGAMAYDMVAQEAVLYGDVGTWTYRGSAWTQRALLPPGHRSPGVAYE
jgi:hypothetical protein